jgi:hypothetical protein
MEIVNMINIKEEIKSLLNLLLVLSLYSIGISILYFTDKFLEQVPSKFRAYKTKYYKNLYFWFLLFMLLFTVCNTHSVNAIYTSFQDNFNRADNATVGNNWNESLRAERFSISNNKLNITRTTGDTYIKHYLGNNPSFGDGVTWVNVSFTFFAASRAANFGISFHNGTFNQFSRGCGLWFPKMTGDDDLYNHFNNFATNQIICLDCITAGTDYKFSLIYNVSLARIWVYIDGVRRGNITMSKQCQNARVIGFGIEDYTGQYQIDNIKVQNLSAAPPSITSNLDVYLRNRTNYNKKLVFGYGEHLRAYGNYTFSNNNSAIPGATCNFTWYNASRIIFGNMNYSLCTTGCTFNTYKNTTVSQTNLSMLWDYVIFKACHFGVSTNVDVTGYICNSPFTVPSATMTQCPTYSQIKVNSTGCKNKDYIQYNLTVNAPASKMILFLETSAGRRYKEIIQGSIYNSTVKVYMSNPRGNTFAYYISGLKSVKVNCSLGTYNSVVTKQFSILNTPPTITFRYINNSNNFYNFTPSVKIEYADGNWTFYTSVSSLSLSNIIYSIRNSSMVIWTKSSKTPTLITTPNHLFLHLGTYNFTIYANDTYKNSTFASRKFVINDTLPPYCNIPVTDTGFNGTNYIFNYTCTDEYFFSFNISCMTTGFSYYKSNIGSTNYSFHNSTLLDMGIGGETCLYEYCDGHTSNDISSFSAEVVTNIDKSPTAIIKAGLNGNIVLSPTTSISKVTLTKKFDRYNFCYDFTGNKAGYATLAIPQNCYPAPNSKIQGHIVCPKDDVWIDFVNKDVSVTIKDDIFLDLTKVKDLSNVCFNSIGKFNCIKGNITIAVTIPPTNSTSRLKLNYCPDTIPGAYMLMVFIVIALFLIYVGFKFLLGISGFFGAVLLMSCSWYLADCQAFLSLVVALISILLMIVFVLVIPSMKQSRLDL